MKYSTKLLMALFGVSLLFSGGVQASGHEWSAEQKEILKMEVTCWDYYKEGDIKGYMTLWHKDFIGWPHWTPKPVGKEAIEREITGQSWFKALSYDLKPEAINIFGNFAVIYYRISYVGAAQRQYSARFVHFWMKQGGRWQIIGGSSQSDY
jgi:ketosteroid isomerase-like protein